MPRQLCRMTTGRMVHAFVLRILHTLIMHVLSHSLHSCTMYTLKASSNLAYHKDHTFSTSHHQLLKTVLKLQKSAWSLLIVRRRSSGVVIIADVHCRRPVQISALHASRLRLERVVKLCGFVTLLNLCGSERVRHNGSCHCLPDP